MNRFNCALAAAAVAVVGFTAIAPKAEAAVNIGIGIGAAPACPYGYYGPEWFSGGVFIGAGPWFHGAANFHGHVDNRFDVHRGYRGPLPNAGDHPEQRLDRIDHFRGNEMRDGRGHAGGGRR